MVTITDTTYLYFGWWLQKDKDGMPTAASAFTGTVAGGEDATLWLTSRRSPVQRHLRRSGGWQIRHQRPAWG